MSDSTQLDFAKYQTGELAEQIVKLVSVPRAFFKVMKSVLLCMLLAAAACYLIYSTADVSHAMFVTVCVYCLCVGAFLGALWGILGVVATVMRSIESILRITLAITGQVATDYEQLQTGQSQMPSGGELVEMVYGKVVMPVIEGVVAKSFGLLGTPLLWIYRRTIGSSVRFLIKRVGRSSMSEEKQEAVHQVAVAGTKDVAVYSEKINRYTDRALTVVSVAGRAIRGFVMRPIYIAFIVCLTIVTIPVWLVCY